MNNKNYPVSLTEIIRAKAVIQQHLDKTPLRHYAELSRVAGADIYIKHENHNLTGSFKIRGGINLMHHLTRQDVPGVITFSTGNHGSSVAFSAARFGLDSVVVVPEKNNPAKNRNILQYGGELIEAGSSFEESAKVVESLCQSRGLYYVHPADEPHLVNGVGTGFLEIMEDLPDLDAVIIPIGAGSELAAAVTVMKTINPAIEIYAVQATASPAAFQSWQQGKIVTAANTTFAGGFATGAGYDLPFEIYKDQLADFILLSEDEIYQGIALAAHYTHNLMEGAGSASLMAALKLGKQLKGKKVALQFSGCNASTDEIINAYKRPAFKGEYNLSEEPKAVAHETR
ncbi:threonine ammonia-lyase [Spongorhabdus nitratireducens]